MDAFDSAMCDDVGKREGSAISAIKARVRPEALLAVAYKRGRLLWARCPAHDDEHPSLAIYPDGHTYCFACGWGGDVIDIYAILHDISIAAAITVLGGTK
jgi:DNA primase